MKSQMNIERCRQIHTARAQGIAAGVKQEQEAAAAVLEPKTLERDATYRHLRPIEVRDLSDFKATEHLSHVIDMQLDARGKFDPKLCSERDFRQVWELRQTIDQTGISYGVYVDLALQHLKASGAKRVHLTMLGKRDVIAHVLHGVAIDAA